MIFVPILTRGHESLVMTERVLSQVQRLRLDFYELVTGVSLRDKVRSCGIRKAPKFESLLRY